MKSDILIKKHIAEIFKNLSQKKSIEKISIREIAIAAEINRSTFYYHFKDKADLVEWIFKTDIVETFISPTNGGWISNVRNLLETFRDCREFYKQIIAMDSYNNLRKFLYDATRKTTELYIYGRLEEKSIDPARKKFIVDFISSGYVETYIHYLENGCLEDPQWMIDLYRAICEPAIDSAISV